MVHGSNQFHIGSRNFQNRFILLVPALCGWKAAFVRLLVPFSVVYKAVGSYWIYGVVGTLEDC